MVFEKNLGSAKTFENAKALKGNIVASEGRLRYRSLKEPLVLHLAQEAEADCRSADDNPSFTAARTAAFGGSNPDPLSF